MNRSRIFTDRTPSWVENVWRENSSQIYKECRVRSNSKEAADDLFQEVALRFCKSVEYLNGENHLGSWFSTVIQNTHYEMHRRSGRIIPMSCLRERVLPYDSVTEAVAARNHNDHQDMLVCDELKFLMEELSPEERFIVDLTFLGGISLKEISRLLGYSKSNLSKIRCTAVEKMKIKNSQRESWQEKAGSPSVLLQDSLTPPAEIS